MLLRDTTGDSDIRAPPVPPGVRVPGEAAAGRGAVRTGQAEALSDVAASAGLFGASGSEHSGFEGGSDPARPMVDRPLLFYDEESVDVGMSGCVEDRRGVVDG